MASFGTLSKSRLSTCHPDLQRLFEEVVKHYDCSVSCGVRDEEEQEILFRTARSKTPPGKSKHNPTHPDNGPDGVRAIDVNPYPFSQDDWKDPRRFYIFAGQVQEIARNMNIKVRWGGDWDSDGDLRDQTFNDCPHWELL
jgi:peptidoglycan L-alanyl-D-glutamate endopeptidase CwlK